MSIQKLSTKNDSPVKANYLRNKIEHGGDGKAIFFGGLGGSEGKGDDSQ